MAATRAKCIGILTSGGDCPGLNAAIRGVAKPAISDFHIEVIGIEKGFRGLVENHARVLHLQDVSGILSLGGTILGTSREKPHKMPMPNGETIDLTLRAVETYNRLGLDCLVCLGGNGTHKVAYNLTKQGLNVIGLPKTIDNDLAATDITFGFDSAVTTAAQAIDRLYSTAEAHLRVMVIELMGHNAGWLTLTAGIGGGADIILIPEIPYDIDSICQHLTERRRRGKWFSIIAVAEGVRVKPSHRNEPAADKKDKKGRKEKGKKKNNPERRIRRFRWPRQHGRGEANQPAARHGNARHGAGASAARRHPDAVRSRPGHPLRHLRRRDAVRGSLQPHGVHARIGSDVRAARRGGGQNQARPARSSPHPIGTPRRHEFRRLIAARE